MTHLKLRIIYSVIALISLNAVKNEWVVEKHKDYNLIYTPIDNKNKKEYNKLFENGIKSVESFFCSSYDKPFDIYIHPNRKSLDSSWQKAWNMPNFKSECWMVASGVASKIDMISPKAWDKDACEHIYSNKRKTQQLITHELVHVYHGQLNISPDFTNTEGIDWFVEGLATYASGQCDSMSIEEIRKAISEHTTPNTLNSFWTGKLRYSLSGSVVMYIDSKYGRTKLKELLPFNKKSEILQSLNTTEIILLNEWINYISERQ